MIFFRGAAALLSGCGVSFADLGADERKGSPECKGPAKTDNTDQDRCARWGTNEEGTKHTKSEEEVGEKPGTAEGEPRDLSCREEAGEARM